MTPQEFATLKHKAQTRRDKTTPYIEHPRAVAQGVSRFQRDLKDINKLEAAAWLHDTLEDTDTSYEEILQKFGVEIADLVQELTSDKEEIKGVGKATYLSHKLEKMSSLALVIKLIDRLHNLSELPQVQDSQWAFHYVLQTQQILDHLSQKRNLSDTHLCIIDEINDSLETWMQQNRHLFPSPTH